MPRGGYRPNSGPKKGAKYRPRVPKGDKQPAVKKGKKEPSPAIPEDIRQEAEAARKDPLTYMLDVMNDPNVDSVRRDRMAMAAAPFCHPRKGEGSGKKEEKAERAKQAAAGKYATGRPPLKVVK